MVEVQDQQVGLSTVDARMISKVRDNNVSISLGVGRVKFVTPEIVCCGGAAIVLSHVRELARFAV